MVAIGFGELGQTGLDHWDGKLREEWDRDLQCQDAVKAYREMEDNSAVVGAWMALVEFLIRQVPLRVDPADDSEAAKAEAARIEESLKDLETPVDTFLSELASAMLYGWVDFEKLFKIRRGPHEEDPILRSKFDDGRIGWRDWAIRSQDTLSRWAFDAKGRWIGLYQAAPPFYREVLIPKEKLLHFIPRSRKRSPEGRSCARSARRSYTMAIAHEEIEAVGAEKNLSGQCWAETPLDGWGANPDPDAKATKDAIVDGLARLRRGEYLGIAFPTSTTKDGKATGYKLNEFTGAKSPFDSDKVIRRYESRILMSLLAEFLILGMDKHGSFALGDRKTDILVMAIGAVLGGVCEILTEAAAELSTLNGVPAAAHVTIRHGDIETPDLTHIASFCAQIIGAGGEMTAILLRHLEREGQLPQGAFGEPQPKAAPPASSPSSSSSAKTEDPPPEDPEDPPEENEAAA